MRKKLSQVFENVLAYSKYFLILFAFVILIVIVYNSAYCKNHITSQSYDGKSLVSEKSKISSGFNLISTIGSYSNLYGKGKVQLVDMFGKGVHEWTTKFRPFYGILEKNGNLIVALFNTEEKLPPGNTGIIQELDWNGDVVWQYKNNQLRLDFDVLPNGNIAALLTEKVPKNISSKIKGGTPSPEDYKGDITAEAIVEINRSGNISWMWHSYEHLDADKDSIGPYTLRFYWPLINSVKYVKEDPFYKEEAYLISMRNLNTIALVKKKDGSFIWKSPKSMLSFQHDPTLLENGDILVFDNNVYRKPEITDPYNWIGSRVIEINPKTNEIVWEFSSGIGLDNARFKAEITSGAQRLKNGNTLIVNGPQGELFEVTPSGELVWSLINPHTVKGILSPWNANSFFKARRYYAEDISRLQNIGNGMPMLSIMCVKIRNLILN